MSIWYVFWLINNFDRGECRKPTASCLSDRAVPNWVSWSSSTQATSPVGAMALNTPTRVTLPAQDTPSQSLGGRDLFEYPVAIDFPVAEPQPHSLRHAPLGRGVNDKLISGATDQGVQAVFIQPPPCSNYVAVWSLLTLAQQGDTYHELSWPSSLVWR